MTDNLLVLSTACTTIKPEIKTQPQCGTYGCVLPNLHNGLHRFTLTGKRNRSCVVVSPNIKQQNDDEKDRITAAKHLKHMSQSSTFPSTPPSTTTPSTPPSTSPSMPTSYPVQQVMIKIAGDDSVIIPTSTIPSLRVRSLFSYHGRKTLFNGTITRITADNTKVEVFYDDGETHWKTINELEFLVPGYLKLY